MHLQRCTVWRACEHSSACIGQQEALLVESPQSISVSLLVVVETVRSHLYRNLQGTFDKISSGPNQDVQTSELLITSSV